MRSVSKLRGLPGAPRLMHTADGYRATLARGEVIVEQGEPTGARPGRLVRGGTVRPL